MKVLYKRMAMLILAIVLTCILTVGASAADLIVNRQQEDTIRNPIAYVQRVNGDTALTGEQGAGIALADVADTDVEAFMRLCMDTGVIPTFRAADKDEAAKVVSAIAATSCKDVTVISADPAVLKYIRNKKVVVRTGLEVTLESDYLLSKEAHEIRTAVRSAPATFCVIDSDIASCQAVAELQELAVAVWVNVKASVRDDDFAVEAIRAFTSGANGIITDNAYATAQLASETFVENTMTRTPVMIGHRGNPTQAPENSLSGFLTAYENGADVFEVDVEITKDGEIIIMHDSTLNRTTTYKGDKTVNEMTLSEIKEVFLLDKNGKPTEEKVPTLREVLEEFRYDKDCRVFIEFKGYNADNVPAALAIVDELNMADHVDVISFNSDFLLQTQKEIEGMSTGFLQSPVGAVDTYEDAVQTFYYSVVQTQNANSTVNPNKSVASAEYIQAATDRGMTVWPWTYSLFSNKNAFLMCPDGVTTDDVQWAKNMTKGIDVADTTLVVFPGSERDLTVWGELYGGDTGGSCEAIDPADCVYQILDGDCVTVENGVLKATDTGTAHVLISYPTKTTDGGEYVLYTQPITIKVTLFTQVSCMIAFAVLVCVGGAMVVALRKCRKKGINSAQSGHTVR